MGEGVKIETKTDKKSSRYKINVVELVKRRDFLGRFSENLSEKNILDDNVYSKAKLERKNSILKEMELKIRRDFLEEFSEGLSNEKILDDMYSKLS